MLPDLLTRLIRPLLSRPVTSRYPRDAALLPATMRGLPDLDASRCDQSAACVTACPTGAITLSDGEDAVWAIDAGRCIFCRACELACPRAAITLGSRFELAAHERSALVTATQVRRP